MPPPSLAPPSSLPSTLSLDSEVEEYPPEPSSDSSDGPPHPTAPSARTPLVATRAHRCQAVRPVFIVLTSRRAPSSDRSATRDPCMGAPPPQEYAVAVGRRSVRSDYACCHGARRRAESGRASWR